VARFISHAIKASVENNAPLRRETLDGRDYIVAPVVILVEGVHNGTTGSLYYPRNAIQESTQFWNGVPVTHEHPMTGDTYISANAPAVVERQEVGRLFNVTFDPDGAKLRAEIWIDEKKADRVAHDALIAIISGANLEVSSGLFYETDEQSGTWHGENYDGTLSDFIPDHLALLPNDTGACSWEDGCGVRANQEAVMKKGTGIVKTAMDFIGRLTDKAKQEFSTSATKDIHCEVEQPFDLEALIENAQPWVQKQLALAALELSHSDTYQMLQHAVDALDNETWTHFVVDVFDDHFIYKAIGSNPTELGTTGRVSVLYKRMYSIAEEQGSVTLGDDAQEVREVTEFVPVGDGGTQNVTREGTMRTKEQVIDALIASDTNGLTENDRGWLKGLPEDRLAKMSVNAEPEPKPAATTEAAGDEPPKKPAVEEAPKEGSEDEPKPDAEAEDTGNAEPKTPVTPAGQLRVVPTVPTVDAYIKGAPPEVAAFLKSAVTAQRKEKDAIIAALVATDANSFTKDELGAMELAHLRKIAALARVPASDDFSLQAGPGEGPEADATEGTVEMKPLWNLDKKEQAN